MNIEKMKEVFADEAFVKGLFALESAAEVQAALKEKGVELTEEEILGIREFFAKVESGEISAERVEQWAAQAESGELPEEMLEQVAGGSVTVTLVVAGIMGALEVLGLLGGSFAVFAGLGYGIDNAIRRRW